MSKAGEWLEFMCVALGCALSWIVIAALAVFALLGIGLLFGF